MNTEDSNRAAKDAVTVGAIRQRKLGLLEKQIEELASILRKGVYFLPEAEKFIDNAIKPTLQVLNEIDGHAGVEVMFPAS